MYDVTRRETFDNITHWLTEFDMYGTVEGAVKMVRQGHSWVQLLLTDLLEWKACMTRKKAAMTARNVTLPNRPSAVLR